MTSKTQIAVLVAALFLGAQAGIAALEQDHSIVAAESAEPAQEQQAEATDPAATEAPEATAAIEQPVAVSEAPAAAPARVVDSAVAREGEVRGILPRLLAFLGKREAAFGKLVTQADTFPRSTDDKDMLPALAAYLEQRDAVLSKLVARGDVFPRSTDDKEMLPALTAYLERRDAALVARAHPQQPESAAAAADDRQLTAPVALGIHQQTAGTSN